MLYTFDTIFFNHDTFFFKTAFARTAASISEPKFFFDTAFAGAAASISEPKFFFDTAFA